MGHLPVWLFFFFLLEPPHPLLWLPSTNFFSEASLFFFSLQFSDPLVTTLPSFLDPTLQLISKPLIKWHRAVQEAEKGLPSDFASSMIWGSSSVPASPPLIPWEPEVPSHACFTRPQDFARGSRAAMFAVPSEPTGEQSGQFLCQPHLGGGLVPRPHCGGNPLVVQFSGDWRFPNWVAQLVLPGNLKDTETADAWHSP